MTFDEALKMLHQKYPGKYVSLEYVKSIYSDAKESVMSPSIKAYVADIGWGRAQSNFIDAINTLEASKDSEADIKDVEIPATIRFNISNISEIEKKHKLTISHEDEEGAFVINDYCEHDNTWLQEAINASKEDGD